MNATAEASVTIEAPADQVWAMVTDVTRMGEWSPENTGGEWLDGAAGPAVGARFKGHNRRGKTKWSTTCEVTEAEPGRSFTFVVGRPGKPETIWRYRFTPTPDGRGVEVAESFELVKALGRASRLLTRVTTGVKDREADMEEGMHQTLAALKQAAESSASKGSGVHIAT